MAGFSELTNQQNPVTFTGKTILLATDVDLDYLPWTPISKNGMNFTSGSYASFGGTFDGQGHVVHNLSNGDNTTEPPGLFGTVYQGTVQNVGVDAANITISEDCSALRLGVLVSWALDSTIQNCWTSGSISCPTDQIIGGLIGVCGQSTQVIGCSSSVNVTSTFPPNDPQMKAPSVGGLVGTFEYTKGALLSDCYFTGSVNVASNYAATGGILGACFDFNGGSETTLTVSNCMAVSDDFSSGDPGTITYIAAVGDCIKVENCLWPDGNSTAVARLILDPGGMSASSDPDFDQSQCGHAVTDFSNQALVDELNAHAHSGITWTMGIDGHPVLATQTHLIAADYSGVDDALAKIPANLSLYTAESAAAVETARDAVDRTLTADCQSEVDAMADAIEDALAALEYKPADYGAVDAAVAKAEALDRSLYTDESLAELDAALGAVVRDKNITEQQAVNDMADAIEDALAALEYTPADYSAVDDALAKIPADLSGYTAESAAAVEAARDAVDRTLTADRQGEVDAMAEAIEAALAALEEVPAPKPEQVAGDKDDLPATGDPTVLLAPALGLVGGAVLLARRRVA